VITAAEIVTALRGAVRLAMRDPGGLAEFDASLTGFWRSFHAAVLLAPFYLGMILFDGPAEAMTISPTGFFLVETIAYVTTWVAFPLAMIQVARLLGREHRYLLFVVATNWTAVIQLAAVSLAPALVAFAGLPATLGGFVALVATIWALIYKWHVTRAALELGGGKAAMVVAFEIGLGLLITAWASAIEFQ